MGGGKKQGFRVALISGKWLQWLGYGTFCTALTFEYHGLSENLQSCIYALMRKLPKDPIMTAVSNPPKKKKARYRVHPSAPLKPAVEGMLLPDEHLIRVVTISPGIYWKGLTVLVIALLLFIKWPPLGILFLIVSGLMLLIAHLTKHFLLLAATDKRILMRSGIINLDVIQLRYSKIESVELAWTLIGQFLGYASVVITGTGQRVTIIPFVADALQFREEMSAILLEKDEKLENAGKSSS